MSTTQPTLTEGLASILENSATHLPEGPRRAFADDRAELVAAGVPSGTLAVGSRVADVDLLDADGGVTTLTAARGDGPAVLVFYRGAWCPYCNLTLRSYEAELAAPLRDRGVRLLAISPQRPEGSRAMSDENALSFPALSDPGNALAGSLGIVVTPGQGAVDGQAELGLVVAERNADGGPELPMPTVAVLDAGGVLRFLDVHPDYTTRTEPSAVLAALDAADL